MKYVHALSPTVRLVAAPEWDAAAQAFSDASYQQSPAYAALVAAQRNERVEHVLIEEGDSVLGAATVRIRTIPLTSMGFAYIAGGPLTRLDRPDDDARLFACLNTLKRHYVDHRGLTLRTLLPLGSPAWNAVINDTARTRGYEQTPHGRRYRTFLLDIDRPLDDIRADCSKYWRRNLRRGEQQAFDVRDATTREDLDRICELYASLRDRKDFQSDLDASFYADFAERIGDASRITASLITQDDRAVSGLITSSWGDTCVPLVFATTEHGLRQYAAYILQWHSIETARSVGMRYYDLGGIDAQENPGVYNFKKGLRGVELNAPGPFEARPVGLAGSIPGLAEWALRTRRANRRAA
jgi:lipid II:glycine glycyltransferase (peptidoglycan interpeptide bridge formation enzyme)